MADAVVVSHVLKMPEPVQKHWNLSRRWLGTLSHGLELCVFELHPKHMIERIVQVEHQMHSCNPCACMHDGLMQN